MAYTNGRNTYDTHVSKFLYGGRLSDALSGSNKIVNGMEDPSFFAFLFGIDTSITGLFSDPSLNNAIGFDMNSDRDYSVLTYLKNAISPNSENLYKNAGNESQEYLVIDPDDLYEKGQDGTYGGVKPELRTFSKEYVEMSRFVNGFKEITINHPYMLQTVDGLQDAYKAYFNSNKDSFLGLKDGKIKIKCLESMDLRMSALFDSYFRSVYNHTYRRMNLPRNILRFDCWLLVHDLRNLKLNDNILYSSIYDETSKRLIVDNLSTILFKFKYCMFDIEEIGAMLGSVSNAESKQTEFEFAFTYSDVEVQVNSLADALEMNTDLNDNQYYDKLDIVSLNNAIDTKTTKTDYIDNAYYDTLNLSGILERAGSSIFNYATTGNVMGNVYDESWAGVLSSLWSSITNGSVTGIINNLVTTGARHIMNRLSDDMPREEYGGRSNVYDNGLEHSYHSVLDEENVYNEEPIANSVMEEENVYEDVQSENNISESDNSNINLGNTYSVNATEYMQYISETKNKTKASASITANAFENTKQKQNQFYSINNAYSI